MSTINSEQNIAYEDFSGGVIDEVAVADSLLPKNCVRKGINALFDRPRGAISGRYGVASVGDSPAVEPSQQVYGLFNHRSATTTNNRLFVAVNGSIYRLSGSSWILEVGALSTGVRNRFITYCDQTAMINGNNGARSTSGNGSWITTGGNLDVGNWPTTTAAAILNGRIFALGDPSNPSRAYKSSIVSSNAISWTSGNGFVDVKPNDGAGALTGITSNGRVILFFKERGLYRYDDNSLEFVVGIGTPLHESIVTSDQGATYYFGQGASTVGFYVTTGGYPKKISRPIQKWVEAISPTNYSNISASTDGNKIKWSVGSITVDGSTYTNMFFVYNLSDQTWEMYNYPTFFTCFAQYITGTGAVTVVGGDSSGFVYTMDSGFTDGAVGATPGTPIFSEVELAPFVLGSRAHRKDIANLVTYARDFQGLKFLMGADGGQFETLGSIDAREKVFKEAAMLRGQKFFPKITCENSGPPFLFEGFNVTHVGDEGVSLLS